MTCSLRVWLALALVSWAIYGEGAEPQADVVEDRVYFMKKCSGGGCPYTASWLSHINLYKKISWWLDSTKMEAASFNIFDRAQLKFQLSDADTYYVHHMSMFEHLIHKKYGFAEAKNKTLIMSKAALAGECNNLQISKTKEYVALIPFYGGLPPGVTKDLTVKSIGQGNSLVDGFTKGLQTMATVCSCLKYYGHVIIGVAREEDRILVNDMLQQKMTAEVRHHVNVVQFQMPKPAHLPFHLLAWGQQYVRVHNCYQFYQLPTAGTGGGAGADGNITMNSNGGASNHTVGAHDSTNTTTTTANTTTPAAAASNANVPSPSSVHRGGATPAQLALFSPNNYPPLDIKRIPASDLFDICHPGAIVPSHQGPFNVVYLKKFDIGRHRIHRHHPAIATSSGSGNHTGVGGSAGGSGGSGSGSGSGVEARHPYPAIKFVYYTESDQIVRFDSHETLRALSAASNESTFFVGKRREKARDSAPEDYMGSLNIWRECGVPGYSLTWPKEHIVRMD